MISQDIEVIVITADESIEASDIKSHGVFKLIKKPFENEEISQALEEFIIYYRNKKFIRNFNMCAL
ncbi:hypothetical protein M1N67_03360 [Peptococcaceae bacterium]|nr:hypothetical protein [Peptococcaceae bacterium]